MGELSRGHAMGNEAPAPTGVVLSGPNGAGKTTASRTLLAEALHLMTFVNADSSPGAGRLRPRECGPGGRPDHAGPASRTGSAAGEFRVRDDPGGPVVRQLVGG